MTDAELPAAALRVILKRAVEASYHRLSVDGDTSTNDTLVLLANGASGVRPEAKELARVEEKITGVMEHLAQAIARDGEGAKKFVTIEVSGAPSDDAAARLARAIANSPLVKPPSPAPTRIGAASFPPPATPVWSSIPAKPISGCKASLSAAAAWPRHFPKPN